MKPSGHEDSSDTEVLNDSETDEEDEAEAFHSANEEDSGAEEPASYQCDQCPGGAEAWGSEKALNHHKRVAHSRRK